MSESTAPRPRLVALALSDSPMSWEQLGFTPRGDAVVLDGVRIELGAPGEGIVGWSLAGVPPVASVDGLATQVLAPGDATSDDAAEHLNGAAAHPNGAAAHPNGALALDHVVVVTPDFERSAQALAAAGMPLRRIRHVGAAGESQGRRGSENDVGGEGRPGFRQGFRRLGPAILELVEVRDAPPGPARFWGLVAIVGNLDALCARLGPELVSAPRAAVQPGRRIATLRRAAGLAQAVAFMSPDT